ncbi:putative nuclease of putative toxin-antitoxin system [Croceifilum oryzae]|uniref:Nuclease of putative toxin-antitoxin system n=1 Tax=Croceifilum oryzae TaxID=1553429 RepID=A0AAJ1TCQ1_9BACL|nr:DUF5615 family PIN-like protein [Croceifilum oryzae]MDQ0415989.1 putative nuclease of putative toxin-antitoxin system [Croceifilum oryzae]
MRLFLDENVTPRVKDFFDTLGYDVETVSSVQMRGFHDEAVFRYAVKEKRIFLTHNGKDFIIQIPPMVHGVVHKGVIWFRFQVTRKNVDQVCHKMHDFFRFWKSFDESIWEVNQKHSNTQVCFIRSYPPPVEEMHI